MASTRSKTRLRECNTAEESTIADSGLVSFGGPASPSTVRRRTVNPDAPAALIPMSGGVTIDHSASERVPTTSPVPPARAVSRAASVSSRSTQASRAAARLRMEYEAAEELAAIQKQDAEIRRELVKKRLAMNLAEIEAATECDEAEEHAVHRTEDSARRVEAWIESTPPVVNVINAAANQAGIPRREGVADDAARTTLPDRVQPGSVARREHSSERGRGLAELADAINKLARPRPIPRQVYELPSFHGNVNEWRLFKNSYEATTSTYEYKPYENLARLRMAVQGKARTAVCHLLAANSKPEDIMAALEKKFGRPEQLVDEVLKEVKVMSRLTDSGREINDFAITTRNCVAVLQEIDEEGHIHNPVLLKEILEKMTPLLRNKFAEYWMMKREEGRREAKLIVLADFLEREAELAAVYARAAAAPQLSASAPGRIAERAPRRREAFKVNTQTEVTAKCPKCASEHKLAACDAFKALNSDEKWDFVKREKLCFKCITKTHPRAYCRAKGCAKCNRGHHTLLHPSTGSDARPARAAHPNESAVSETVTNIGTGESKALLKIVPVTIRAADREIKVHALLDDGATVTLLDDSVASHINAKGPRAELKLISARGHQISDRNSRRIKIKVRGPNGVERDIQCRTITRLDLPSQSLTADEISSHHHLNECHLEALRDARPLLLIGQDNWELITGSDVRRGKSGEPVASLTGLGWVVHGRRGRTTTNDGMIHCLADLELAVREHFEIESLGITQRERENAEVKRASRILNDTTRRIGNKWETGLLWKEDDPRFPDNYNGARKRLTNIENKMDRDPAFAAAYTAQIEKLIENGYARRLENRAQVRDCFFLPHFAVTNPNKPNKIRVVFDAAARFEGKSLNDYLLSGPDLLNSLTGILFRFRIGSVAFTGDIRDMFLRVRVCAPDQRAQLFLWRGADRDSEPRVYAMTSLIFGASSSPTSAIYVLNKNAETCSDEYPNAEMAVKRDHYVDDFICSTDSVPEAAKLISDVTIVHARGGFDIRGWATNAPELKESLSAESSAEAATVSLHKTKTERALGLIWEPECDSLGFDVTFKKLPRDIVNGKNKPTKRQFLSLIMSIFDPLGLLCPVTIKGKILMQRIWRSGIGWDDVLLERDYAKWVDYLDEVRKLSQLRIPRCYALRSSKIELHVFGDASEHAYAAVAYWRAVRPDGTVHLALVAGKSRVAPNKVMSIPRLELQAALLACRLATNIQKEHGIATERRVLWCDSKTVLRWIRSDPRAYKPFVAHRLAELDERSDRNEWRWVNSADNPADDATRADCDLERWLNGPTFLLRNEDAWPIDNDVVDERVADDEVKGESINVVCTTHTGDVIDVTRFSSWTRLVRTYARVLYFIRRLRKQQQPFGADDVIDAETRLLRASQRRAFSDEMRAAAVGAATPRGSSLRALDVMLTDDWLRVGGRLRRSPTLSFDEKHPIILDGRDHAVRLLVEHYHRRAGHANHEAVVNIIRERFWITRLRPTVKKVANACRLCRVRRAQPVTPKMADLPGGRLAFRQRPFTHTGVDYFGPLEVTVGRRREKRWAALFTCLTTRAVHMEVASSLSADSMIMALRRFMARRGQPDTLYSDHGTNFVGAAAELSRARLEIEERMSDEATTRAIRWLRIPPHAPHMGGSWERLVRSIKVALSATLHTRAPKDEVLHTLLLEAEFVVNSRPLTHISVLPSDPTALTPNHFLLGSAAGRWQPGHFDTSEECSRKQWRASQALAEMFWQRWLREYLPTLQRRHKWTEGRPPIKVGDAVVITDPALPRNTWPRGIVERVYPGIDGQVRVVDIRTAHGRLRRPTARLAVLPTEVESSHAPTGGGLLTAELRPPCAAVAASAD